MRKIFVVCAAILSMMGVLVSFAFCGGSKVNSYPMPTPGSAKDVMSKMHSYLNSEVGRASTADQLAHLSDDDSTFCLNLPITDEDVRPLFDVAYRDSTGETLMFSQETFDGDTINPIGTARFFMEPTDSAVTFRVHARGKGLYTFYNIKHWHCHCINHDKHPDGFPEYEPCIVLVKPGAEEIFITYAHEDEEYLYRRVDDN